MRLYRLYIRCAVIAPVTWMRSVKTICSADDIPGEELRPIHTFIASSSSSSGERPTPMQQITANNTSS